MTLEDLGSAWRAKEEKLELRLLLRDDRLRRARWALRRTSLVLVVECAAALFAISGLASFSLNHLDEGPVALAGALLGLGVIAFLRLSAMQLLGRFVADPEQSVAAMQGRLAAIKVLQLRKVRWSLLAGPLAWALFAMVALRAGVGADPLGTATRAWVFANLAFGVAFLIAGGAVARKLGQRLQGSPRLARLTRALAGETLSSALEQLDEVASFSAEPERPRR